MRPLLLLLVAVSAFAADPAAKLRIYELGAPGADKLSDLPARYAEAMSMGYTAEMPNPVFRLSNLAFLPADRSERLDLYVQYARDFKVRRPGVLFIHGGGFTAGDKAEYRSASVSADLARAGYVVVSCNYMLGAKDKPGVWPRNIADCRDAIRWMRANADALGLDPDRIAVAGGSAGGYLALMVGLSDDKTGPGGDPSAKHSAKVSAVIDMYGVVNFSKHGKGVVPGVSAADQAAYLPENQCDVKDPAVLILHGTADTTVDIQQSKDMVAALKKGNVIHEFIIVEGAPHTFDLHPKGTGWHRSYTTYSKDPHVIGLQGGSGTIRMGDPDLLAPTLDFLARTIGK
jgi:acetyl esterase/lipase